MKEKKFIVFYMAHIVYLHRVVMVTIVMVVLASWILFNWRFRHIYSGNFGCADPRIQRLKREHFIDNTRLPAGLATNITDKILTVLEQMDDSLVEDKKSFISFLFQPVINDHNFEYLLNPTTTCLNSRTDFLIVVPSAPGNFQKRLDMRRGECGKYAGNAKNHAKLLFFIGRTNSAENQSRIDAEYNAFHDIVQESFEDVYKNIRYKAVSMLRWASTFCQRAMYVIRNDDDVSINMTSVTESLRRISLTYSNFIAGRMRVNDRPARNVNNKAYLPVGEYPAPSLPPFALGGLLGYPMLTVELLYQAALRVKPIWLDDVYITGICAQKVGAKLLNDSAFIFTHIDVGNWDQ
ncbi:hypothetical protein Btru_014727 [Bulinus truncatus]|nr:hypothetical protein Btru_014727 [Bulinus truncatus]